MSNGCLLFSASEAFFKTDNGIPLSLTGNIKTDILPPQDNPTSQAVSSAIPNCLRRGMPVSYTHLTLPTMWYV